MEEIETERNYDRGREGLLKSERATRSGKGWRVTSELLTGSFSHSKSRRLVIRVPQGRRIYGKGRNQYTTWVGESSELRTVKKTLQEGLRNSLPG